MLSKIGSFFADKFKRWLPDSFIFALLLTIIAGILAIIFVDAKPFGVIQAWYKGFWILLKFAMQMLLILVTGYAIAISPPAVKFIDWIASKIKSPVLVYAGVIILGTIFVLISWGWVVMTAVMAKELGKRVKKVDYRLLAACVYVTLLPWHGGLSGSIPLLLNTPHNFIIKSGVFASIIPTSITLGSMMNIGTIVLLIITLPILMVVMKPSDDKIVEFNDLMEGELSTKVMTVAEEAENLRLPDKNFSDMLNNSIVTQILISLMGAVFIIWHFATKGFDINLNIMNFLFIIVGMVLHVTPIRYVIAMKRSCNNVSGIVLQFPFYAGIMGIMIFTGLGKAIAVALAGMATIKTFPFVAFLIGGLVNIFVPSGGGEWAVVGQPIVEAAKHLGAALPADQLMHFVAKCSMAVAYGDSLTNMIQPFWTLTFFPIIAAGLKLQPRDIMGYTFVAMLWSFFVFGFCILFLPV